MESAQRWRDFFDAHAPFYEQNVFTKATAAEVTFLEEVLDLKPGARILDLGCGTGRHSIELAKRGYAPTGVDISPGMLEVARKNAAEAGVEIDFIEVDAAEFRTDLPFDHVICLCEGGFNLADFDEDPVAHDLGILRSAFENLATKGRFVLTCLNGYQVIRQMTDDAVAKGSFNPVTMISHYQDTWSLPEGERTMMIRERLFIPPEVIAMLRHIGFEVLHVWGGTAGEWGKRVIKLDEIEVMYVATRP